VARAGGSSGRDGNEFRYTDAEAGAPDAAGTGDSATLENVLRETLDALTREKISRKEIEALREVAARHRARPLSDEPVTAELVDAILDSRFDLKSCPPAQRRDMAIDVANALYEGPVSRQRLEQLWRQLQESL
jgi:hypothetical protein